MQIFFACWLYVLDALPGRRSRERGSPVRRVTHNLVMVNADTPMRVMVNPNTPAQGMVNAVWLMPPSVAGSC